MIEVDINALFKRLNAYCTRSLETAAGMCVSRGNYEVTIEHVLLALLNDTEQDFYIILKYFGIDPSRVEKSLHHALEQNRSGNPGKPVFSPILIEWIQQAWLIASIDLCMGDISSGALLVALKSNIGRYGYNNYMAELESVKADELRLHFIDITAESRERNSMVGAEYQKGDIPSDVVRSDSALGRFTINFTELARKGDIDPVFCRDREIRQMVDILARRRKNNPIAVGEAGVGKTAVVEGLALKIAEGDVPDILRNAEIYSLDLGLLQAGASVKGEFENRLKSVIEEVKSSAKPIILFIDEAHTLIGAGGMAGGSDAANLLKPALARGELRTVAATTWSEYKKYFEKDPALARRFQLVKLEEPSPEDAVTIIRGLREKYEEAHGVYVRDDAVEAAAQMSARYISGRQLPDKAVDVLDTAAARVKISVTSKPDIVNDRERKVKTLKRTLSALRRDIEVETLIDDGRVAELEAKISGIEQELTELHARWEKESLAVKRVLELRQKLAKSRNNISKVKESGGLSEEVDDKDDVDAVEIKESLDQAMEKLADAQGNAPLVYYEVSPEVVAQVISDWTGIPLGKMVKDEAKSILNFKDDLNGRIKGQGQAVMAVDEGVRAAKAGLNNPNTPIGIFLFVGPSGVGKTEMGLSVADLLFGGERFIVTVNMSEFQEKHTVSRLIGSPPGYVGFGEGGMLTEAVRQRPYSVVLLDEVEKADLEVMNLFYQVFDKGTLTDGEGREIDFKNTILILTSNLASDVITQMCEGSEPPSQEHIMQAIRPILSNHFKPALLARMQIVPFFPLANDSMKDIVELKLDRLADRLMQSHKMALVHSPAVVEQIAQRCTEVETGARNVDHIINRNLLPHISTELLGQVGMDVLPHTLMVDIGKDGNFVFQFESKVGE